MTFNQIPQLLYDHLGPTDPVEIDFPIRYRHDCIDTGSVASEELKNERVINLPIQIDEPTPASRQMELYNNEIDTIDSQISELVDKINQHKRKRDFMLNFAHSPVEFLDHLVDSQIRDMQLMQTEGPTDEEIRHSSYYYQPQISDAVHLLFQNHLTQQ